METHAIETVAIGRIVEVRAECGCNVYIQQETGAILQVVRPCRRHETLDDGGGEADAMADALHEALIDMDRDPIAYGRY